jgi:hypothetical protein
MNSRDPDVCPSNVGRANASSSRVDEGSSRRNEASTTSLGNLELDEGYLDMMGVGDDNTDITPIIGAIVVVIFFVVGGVVYYKKRAKRA